MGLSKSLTEILEEEVAFWREIAEPMSPEDLQFWQARHLWREGLIWQRSRSLTTAARGAKEALQEAGRLEREGRGEEAEKARARAAGVDLREVRPTTDRVLAAIVFCRLFRLPLPHWLSNALVYLLPFHQGPARLSEMKADEVWHAVRLEEDVEAALAAEANPPQGEQERRPQGRAAANRDFWLRPLQRSPRNLKGDRDGFFATIAEQLEEPGVEPSEEASGAGARKQYQRVMREMREDLESATDLDVERARQRDRREIEAILEELFGSNG